MENVLPPDAKMVFKGEIFEVWQWEQKMYDGSSAIFERVKRCDSVQVVAVVGDSIMIQTQSQPDHEQSFISLPGGQCDRGEDALVSAQRELLEETGYVSDDWSVLRENNSMNKVIWAGHVFIARNCIYKQEPHFDKGEKIENKLVSFEEFLVLLQDPSFRDKELALVLSRVSFDPDFKAQLHKKIFGM